MAGNGRIAPQLLTLMSESGSQVPPWFTQLQETQVPSLSEEGNTVKRFEDFSYEHGQNLALTVLYVPSSLVVFVLTWVRPVTHRMWGRKVFFSLGGFAVTSAVTAKEPGT